MAFFPTLCVEDFFPNPDQIRNYALTSSELNWRPAEDGAWPGVRSCCCLREVNYNLFREIATRYFLLHYAPNQLPEISFEASMRFQRIKKYVGGWVHNDYPDVQSQLIYLTPNAPLNSGTGLYKLKDISNFKGFEESKKKLFNNEVSSEEVEKDRIENNNQFEKTAYFSNIYNRCVCFDCSIWHCGDEFPGEDERLTLIIFWEKINGPMTSLQNSKSFPSGTTGNIVV